MKVVQIIPSLGYGGAEREVARIAALLAKTGVDSEVVCLYEEGHLSGHVEDCGATVTSLNLDRNASLFRRMRILTRAIKKNRYDVVHVHLVTWAVIAARMAGTDAVFLTEHGLSLYKKGFAILFDRVIALLCSRVVVVAKAIMKVRQEQWKIPAKKMVYLPNSVDPSRFDFTVSKDQLKAECGVPVDDWFVLSVGSLLPVKGHTDLIHAAAQVIAEFPNVTFAIAGGGDLYDELARQVGELDVSSRFLLLGYRDDVERLLKAADIFVMSSLREGTSIALLEAMAAGVPVVATDVGGNPELVSNRGTGMLVPPSSPAALAEAVSSLIRDHGLRKVVSNEARHKVQTNFSEAVNLKRLKQLYAGVLNERF